MENEVIDSNNGQGFISDSEIKGYLMETAKWAKFLSILGFIGIGFIVIAALFAGAFLGSQPGLRGAGFPFSPAVITLFYFVIAAIAFFPTYYLYNFSTKVKNAFLSDDNALLRESFKNLKSLYKFRGISAIVIISLYILTILIMIFAAASYS